jgi:Phage Terminase
MKRLTKLDDWRSDPLRFIETVLYNPGDDDAPLNEAPKPFVLLPAERDFLKHAFQLAADGHLLYPEQVYAAPKKSGKTAFAALHMLTTVLLFGGRFAEGYALANDYEQAVSRVFQAIRRIVEVSPLLRRTAKVTAGKIIFPDFHHATISAITSDYTSAAGANPTESTFDELWGYTSERSRRLWDEMVPPPTRKIACRLTVTYAGFSGESVLLEELSKRGLALPEVAPSLYAGDGLLMAWHHEPVAPWQTERWLENMRRSLRPNQFLRMIENRFVTSEASFISLSDWDACVEPNVHPVIDNKELPVWVGVDASHRHDHTAIIAVTRDGSRVRLVTHRIFKPDPNDPIDYELTIEATLVAWAQRFSVRAIWFDPWQMQSTAQRLSKRGLPIREFQQTVGNLTAASQNLFDLVQGRNLIMYEFGDLRLAVSRAVAVETSRGWRIAKEKASHKIDAVVVLAIACHAAVSMREPDEPPIAMPWATGKNMGEIGAGVDVMPVPAPEPATATDRPMSDIEKMERVNSIPPPQHYLKSSQPAPWSAGTEQRSMRDRWSVPYDY